MQFLSKFFALFLLTFSALACEGEALTTFNGNHPEGGFDCRRQGDNCKAGFACDNGSGQCVAKTTSPKCRLNSDCDAGEICNSGQCVPEVAVCTPECDGKTCGNDGCGGSCGTCDAGETCAVSGVCKTSTNTSCAEVGCKGNYTCNVNTGECELNANKAGKCYIRTANGSDFTVNGGGVNKLSDALSGWSNSPIKSVDGVAVVSIGTAKYLSFNAFSTSNWGADGIPQNLYGYYTSKLDFRIATDIYVECVTAAGTFVNAEIMEGPQAPTASESTTVESVIGQVMYFVSGKSADHSRVTVRAN